MPSAAVEWTPSQADTLAGIGRAFFASLARDAHPVFSATGIFVGLVLLACWIGSDRRRGRAARAALRARHEVAMAATATDSDHRTWVRVAARLPIAIQHIDSHHRFFYEHLVTRDLSAGAVSFLCSAPPEPGRPIHFTLDLGEKWPLSLRGVVARTDREAPGAASLVVVSLGQITPPEREHLARWIAREETREIEQAHGGRLCSRCKRPMADGTSSVHPSCATATTSRGPAD